MARELLRANFFLFLSHRIYRFFVAIFFYVKHFPFINISGLNAGIKSLTDCEPRFEGPFANMVDIFLR